MKHHSLHVLFALAFGAVLAHAQQLSFKPLHENGIYALGERAGWTVTGPQDAAAKYNYVAKKNGCAVIKTGVFDLSSGAARIEASVNEPAMVYVEVRHGDTPPAAETSTAKTAGCGPWSPAGAEKPIARLGAAIAPTQLKPSVPRPADFDAFWAAKLKALSEIPMNPALTRTETKTPGVELYTVKLDSVGSKVQGYLAKPAREGKFPALLIFQYAGVYALKPETATDRAAEGWLTFNVDSHDLPPSQATGVSPRYQMLGNTDRETAYFLNMYLRDSRAVDYLASRPDWDGKTIVAMGTSMGGQQSLVTAGLNNKITTVLVDEPSGDDFDAELNGRKAGYPNWPADNPKVMETGLYFDTVNFASKIKARALVAVGFIDTIVTPAGVWTAFNQIPGPKEIVGMVESDHNNITPDKQGAWESRSSEVLRLILSGGVFRPNEELTRSSK